MKQDIAKWIAIFLTLIGMLIGGTWLVSDSIAETKSWTIEQDNVTKEHIMKDVEKRYVPKEDFVRIETDLKYMREMLSRMEKKLDRL